MECEYAKQGRQRSMCECTLRGDMCGYVYYCHPESRIKNTSGYLTCVRRVRANEKKEKGEKG